MEIGAVSTAQFRSGERVVVRMENKVTVEGTVDFTIPPFKPGDELFCVVKVPIPASELRRP